MFTVWRKIAENKIREAIDNGEFENIPGAGETLNIKDDSHIPQELRMAHKILKNANCLPPELELKKEILRTEEMLAKEPDEEKKYKQMKKLNYLVMKLNMTRRIPISFEEKEGYFHRIVDKM